MSERVAFYSYAGKNGVSEIRYSVSTGDYMEIFNNINEKVVKIDINMYGITAFDSSSDIAFWRGIIIDNTIRIAEIITQFI